MALQASNSVDHRQVSSERVALIDSPEEVHRRDLDRAHPPDHGILALPNSDGSWLRELW